MPKQLDETLYNVGEEVFENLAFVLTMPEDDGFGDFDMCDFEPASFDDDGSSETEASSTDAVDATAIDSADADADASDCEEFAGIDFDDDFGGTASGETLVVNIHFRGEGEGELFLEASMELLPIIGMNMLGLDDPNALSHEEQKDAFRELLNVVCGNVLPAIAGEKAVFNIDSPEFHSESTIPETYEGKEPLASAHFGLEVGHAKLALFADESICQLQESGV